jgi:ribonuclease MRP protein subunit SNM1
MALSESAIRLNYLRSSADTVNIQSPSTTAYLMSIHNQILYEDLKPLKPPQQASFCGACGSLRSPEFTKIVRIRPRNVGRKPPGKIQDSGQDAAPGAVVYKCLRCHKRVVLPLQQAKPQNTQKQSRKISDPIHSSTDLSPSHLASMTPALAKPASDNASSKRRAKMRKQSGLQSLLASKQASQASRTPSSQLDLLDFLLP